MMTNPYRNQYDNQPPHERLSGRPQRSGSSPQQIPQAQAPARQSTQQPTLPPLPNADVRNPVVQQPGQSSAQQSGQPPVQPAMRPAPPLAQQRDARPAQPVHRVSAPPRPDGYGQVPYQTSQPGGFNQPLPQPGGYVRPQFSPQPQPQPRSDGFQQSYGYQPSTQPSQIGPWRQSPSQPAQVRAKESRTALLVTVIAVAVVLALVAWVGFGAARGGLSDLSSGTTKSVSATATAQEAEASYKTAQEIAKYLEDWTDNGTTAAKTRSALDDAIAEFKSQVGGDPDNPQGDATALGSAKAALDSETLNAISTYCKEVDGWVDDMAHRWELQVGDTYAADVAAAKSKAKKDATWEDIKSAFAHAQDVDAAIKKVQDDIKTTVDHLHSVEAQVTGINAAENTESAVTAAVDRIASIMGVEIIRTDDYGAEYGIKESGDDMSITVAFFVDSHPNQIFINTQHKEYDYTKRDNYMVTTVKHELSHRSVFIACGTGRPVIAKGRYEALAEAYSYKYFGVDGEYDQEIIKEQVAVATPGEEAEAFKAYIVNDSDYQNAQKIHDSGTCM